MKFLLSLLLGIVVFPFCTHAAQPPLPPALRERVEGDWARQEQVIRKGSATTAKAVDGVLERGRMLCDDLARRGIGDTSTLRKVLDEVAAERTRLGDAGTAEKWCALYRQARWGLRDAMLAHPRLAGDRLLFVKRQWPRIDHQCAHRVGESQTPGANLCELTDVRGGGKVREILDAGMAKGGVGRPDLSFDGTHIVFPYARPRTPPTNYRLAAGHSAYDPADPKNSTAYRGGACQPYDIYTVAVDGTELRRVTADDAAEIGPRKLS